MDTPTATNANAELSPGAHKVEGNDYTSAAHVKVSAFKRCTHSKPIRDVTLAEVAAVIKSGKLSTATAEVRKALAEAGGDKKADSVAAAKKELPCVTFSGTGPGHKAADLQEHSSLVQLDFDAPQDPQALALAIKQDAHIALAFVSPTGQGIKAALRVQVPEGLTPDELQRWHGEQAFPAAQRYSREAFAEEIDPACKDPMRLAYLAHDGSAHFNPDAIPLPVEAPDKLGLTASYYREAAENLDDNMQSLAALLERTIDEMEELDLDVEEGRSPRVSAAEIAVPLRLALDEIDGISHRLPAPGLRANGTPRKEFAEAMQRSEKRADFATWAKEQGFTGDLRELDILALLDAHGFTQEKRARGLAIACPWEHEHSTGTNGTDTLVFRNEDERRGFPWGFECRHGHCQSRTIRDVLTELEKRKPGSVDAHCRKAYAQASVVEEEPEEAFTPPAFPLDALNPVARSIVSDIADIADVDPALPGAAALAVIAATIGKGAFAVGAMRDLSKRTPANLLIAASAPTGYGKSCVEPILEPLRRINAELAEEFERNERGALAGELAECEAIKKRVTHQMSRSDWHSKTGAEVSEARSELARASARIEQIKPLLLQPPQMIVGSAPGAALAQAMQRNKETLFSFGYEAGDIIRIALGRFSKDGKGDFDLILSSYTGEEFRENRVTRAPTRLEKPCLSALWLCQPSLLAEAVSSPEARERGMLSRLIYSINERDLIPYESAECREPNEEARLKWEEAIANLHGHIYSAGAPVIFHVTHEAREVFRALRNRSADACNSGAFRDESDLMSRLRENAIRLALGQAALDAWTLDGVRAEITAQQAERGVALAEWGLYSLLRFLGPARHKRRQDRLRALEDALNERGAECSLRILRDSHGFSPEEVKRLAAQFPSRLAVEKHGTRRKGEVCILKPKGAQQ